MPFLIKLMFPEGEVSGVGMVLTLAVGAPERIGTRLTFLCFELRRIDLIVCFAIPCKFSVVDGLVWAIAFDTFCPLYSTNASSITPLPAVFALGNIWIYVGALNSSDEPFDIEPLVDEGSGLRATLGILYIDPYDGYIGFGRNLYDSWFRD